MELKAEAQGLPFIPALPWLPQTAAPPATASDILSAKCDIPVLPALNWQVVSQPKGRASVTTAKRAAGVELPAATSRASSARKRRPPSARRPQSARASSTSNQKKQPQARARRAASPKSTRLPAPPKGAIPATRSPRLMTSAYFSKLPELPEPPTRLAHAHNLYVIGPRHQRQRQRLRSISPERADPYHQHVGAPSDEEAYGTELMERDAHQRDSGETELRLREAFWRYHPAVARVSPGVSLRFDSHATSERFRTVMPDV